MAEVTRLNVILGHRCCSWKLNPNVHFQKIKAVYVKDPAKYATLQNILEAERDAHGAAWPKVGATLALMWLKR